MSQSISSVENIDDTVLSALETEVIDLFVNGVRVLGLPKSIGEIYGLLYASPRPLSFDDILGRLQISKGSTSQGLKFLRSLGAVRSVYIAGARRDHFVAETELKKLVSGFLREEFKPHLDSGSDRLSRLRELMSDQDPADQAFFRERIGKLSTWHTRSKQLMPLIERFLS